MPPPRPVNDRGLKALRQELRKNMTPAEAALWALLKGRQLCGRKFRRQQSFGPYIVDFYCPEEGLVIELDGDVHNNPQCREYDSRRQEYLMTKGLTVLRFENAMVFQQRDNLLAAIQQQFQKK